MKYLLITYIRKPNGQIDESVTVSRKLKKTDLQMCNIIMDYSTKQVVKGVVEGKLIEKDWDHLNEYYRKVYTNLVNQLEADNAPPSAVVTTEQPAEVEPTTV